jgi:glycosyltransferase involved in cell wall biosynthesis
VSPDKIKVVLQGVDPSWFTPAKNPSPRAKPFLLYVGNIKPHKNLSRLVDAFGRIKDQIPHDLLLIGQKEGFRTGDQKVEAQSRVLGERIAFTGYLPTERLRDYLAHATALVFPSLYEGFGLPMLEAMACGCAVIASNAASLPEVGGDAALYFEPRLPSEIAAKILEVVQDEALRQSLKKRGLARAREFSWEKTAEETSRVIDSIVI